MENERDGPPDEKECLDSDVANRGLQSSGCTE